jgi:hypothetical protein
MTNNNKITLQQKYWKTTKLPEQFIINLNLKVPKVMSYNLSPILRKISIVS